jgi:hypothetical protein
VNEGDFCWHQSAGVSRTRSNISRYSGNRQELPTPPYTELSGPTGTSSTSCACRPSTCADPPANIRRATAAGNTRRCAIGQVAGSGGTPRPDSASTARAGGPARDAPPLRQPSARQPAASAKPLPPVQRGHLLHLSSWDSISGVGCVRSGRGYGSMYLVRWRRC